MQYSKNMENAIGFILHLFSSLGIPYDFSWAWLSNSQLILIGIPTQLKLLPNSAIYQKNWKNCQDGISKKWHLKKWEILNLKTQIMISNDVKWPWWKASASQINSQDENNGKNGRNVILKNDAFQNCQFLKLWLFFKSRCLKYPGFPIQRRYWFGCWMVYGVRWKCIPILAINMN